MNRQPPPSSTSDILVVTTLCFGWFIFGSILSVVAGFPTDGFTDSTFFEIIATELILGGAALGYLYFRGHNLALFIPAPTAYGSLAGVALCAAATFASWVIASAFMAGDSSAQPVDQMVADSTFSLVPLLGVSIVNGLYEETFLVGYLQRALEGYGASFALGASLLVRMSYHLYQGPAGAAAILGFGAVLGLYFLRTRKLWPIVFAHMLADILGFSMS